MDRASNLFTMLTKIKNIIINLPETIRLFVHNKYIVKDILNNKSKLIELNSDYQCYIDYILKNKAISVFNADFENSYSPEKIIIHKDVSTNLPYVLFKQKKLFYQKTHSFKWIQNYHSGLLLEQDTNSPHLYLSPEDKLADFVIFDLGSAEGIFSLNVVEDAKHVYMFEADASWNKSLAQTFMPWLDKVTIVNKLVSDTTTDNSISLKDYVANLLDTGKLSKTDKIFIKLDIEGYEKVVLEDIRNLLSQFSNVQMAICVYHNQEDEQSIIEILKNDYSYYFQNGYMLFYYDRNIKYPYFRHGVLRAQTINKE